MTPWDFQSLTRAFAGRALNTIAEGVALAGFSWLMLRFVRTGSAVTRFAVWFSFSASAISRMRGEYRQGVSTTMFTTPANDDGRRCASI